MSLSEDIVKKIDKSHDQLVKVYEKLDPNNYTKSYQEIWKIRAELEFIVISIKLLNNLNAKSIGEKWKDEFSETVKQVRAEKKVRIAFLETIELFENLENINNIIEFYKSCWILKEKLTVLLNVVKPKIKIQRNDMESNKEKGGKQSSK